MDITAEVSLPSNHWDGDDMEHSFRPGMFHMASSFPDWDGDGFPDYYYNNHFRKDFAREYDFGLNRPAAAYNISSSSSSLALMVKRN